MSLIRSRFNRALELARTAAIKLGVPPTFEVVQKAFKDEPAPDEPLLKVRRQQRKKRFNIQDHNNMLEEADQDFSLLFKEVIDQSTAVLRFLSFGDSTLRKVIHDSRISNDLLEYELATAPGIAGYFFGNYDNFRDLSKIDLSLSTVRIDLGTESVTLPLKGDVEKLDLSFLSTRTPSTEVVDAFSHVVSIREVPGETSKNAFDSLNTTWQTEIVSTKPDGITVIVEFDLHESRELVPASAVIVDSMLFGSAKLEVEYKPDSSNFVKVKTDREILLTGAKARVQLPESKARSLRLRFTIQTPQRTSSIEEVPVYYYYLPIREIEVYKEGYSKSASLVSNTLSPISEDAISTIDKVSLEVNESLPEGTSIKYQISTSNEPTVWLDISPINRPAGPTPRLIDFGQIKKIPSVNNVVDITSASTYTFSDGSTQKNGKTLSIVHTFTNTPKVGSVEVNRGLDGWSVLSNEGQRRVVAIRGNFLSFPQGVTTGALYREVIDEEIKIHPVSDGSSSTYISTAFEMVDFSGCDAIVADSGSTSSAPCYVISKITMIPDSNGRTIGNDTSALSFSYASDNANIRVGTAIQGLDGEKLLEFPNGLAVTTDRVVGERVSLSYQDSDNNNINGVFLVSSSFTDGTKITLLLADPDDILENRGGSLSGSFLSLNLKNDVVSVSGNQIELISDIAVLAGDAFVVSYRRKLSSAETLLPSSVEVVSGTDNSVKYQQGVDFTIDASKKVISVVPGGAISSYNSNIRINYSIETRNKNLHTYRTFFDSSLKTAQSLQVSSLSLMDGESAVLLTSIGEYDLSSSSQITIPPGTCELVVVSRPLRVLTSSVDTDTAIYKTINLTDSDGQYLFSPGRYVGNQRAFKAPMKETSLFRLRASVHKDDYTFFAVDGESLLFSFDPSDIVKSDVFMLPPGTSYPLTRERIAIGYSYTPTNVDNITGVRLRATLERVDGSRAEVTPTLFGYNLRFLDG